MLGLLAAIFHVWYASTMPAFTPISEYFLASGILFLVGSVLVLPKGTGILFGLGAWGLLALSVIDNGLLYYTRSYGLGILSSLVFRPRSIGGNYSQFPTNSTTRGPSFNGTGHFAPTHAGFGRGLPWSTSWSPPGSVQFFVLQSAIIVVAIVAVLMASRRNGPKTEQTSGDASTH